MKCLFYSRLIISDFFQLVFIGNTMSLFSDLKEPPPVELFVINQMFMDDMSDKKVGLGAGGKIFSQ